MIWHTIWHTIWRGPCTMLWRIMSFSSATVQLSSFLSGHRKDSRQYTRPVLLAATTTLDGLYETRTLSIRALGPSLHSVQHHPCLKAAQPILDLAWTLQVWANDNVLPTPSTPAHCLQSPYTARNQQNRPGARNIIYNIVISLIVAVPILILIVITVSRCNSRSRSWQVPYYQMIYTWQFKISCMISYAILYTISYAISWFSLSSEIQYAISYIKLHLWYSIHLTYDTVYDIVGQNLRYRIQYPENLRCSRFSPTTS
jgi:hypothetical protein